ncbi:uncharacterized protein LOC34620340 [Cyclospora cayetanensis]|uniref:Uncharacterized protein LOC34620340 n=1 Tax=Cyclospora cayetanensis TaxID=88456 RepID=A0A6P5WDZ7_9EIME|nr:uncharacterized protein LOC34620340 [Cyclospora cayetanensis]
MHGCDEYGKGHGVHEQQQQQQQQLQQAEQLIEQQQRHSNSKDPELLYNFLVAHLESDSAEWRVACDSVYSILGYLPWGPRDPKWRIHKDAVLETREGNYQVVGQLKRALDNMKKATKKLGSIKRLCDDTLNLGGPLLKVPSGDAISRDMLHYLDRAHAAQKYLVSFVEGILDRHEAFDEKYTSDAPDVAFSNLSVAAYQEASHQARSLLPSLPLELRNITLFSTALDTFMAEIQQKHREGVPLGGPPAKRAVPEPPGGIDIASLSPRHQLTCILEFGAARDAAAA